MIALLLPLAPLAHAAPPDLTNGGVPGDTVTINLGPTGMRGWVYHVSHKTAESRQILVHSVAAGSPAAGVLAANDVILGADGTGLDPANFSYDARVALADAINEAEARNPATLKLLRWRAGTTTIVDITLRTMGAYSATAPYNCPKSTKILDEGINYIMGTNTLGQTIAQETPGRYAFGTLALLAKYDPGNPTAPENVALMARIEPAVLALIPSQATMDQMMSDVRDSASMIVWSRGHHLVVLAEYYLVTGDTRVLPAIEAHAVNYAKNQSMFGTVGHIFAEKNLDGSNNGPMGGGYGTVNSAGMPCFLGLLLARQCGLTNPETLALMDAAIERTSSFFAYFAGRGAIPYGEHEPYATAHESNGKSGLAALCFSLQSNREYEGKFNCMMATAATSEREIGHTGAFFNYLWSPLGAATGGEDSAASYFRRARWHFDLCRRWDGGFDYDCLYGEGPHSGATYNDFRMSTAALLVYALPHRKLHLTGRGHDPARNLTSQEVAAAEQADGYVASLRSTGELVTDLGGWSPMVQRRAAEQLATRTIDTALLSQLTSMATDPNGTSRIGAIFTLGKISNSATANSRAATLAGLLTDPENHVRFMAAEAMRYLPQTAKMTQLNAVLSAAASTAAPLLPLNEEDPLHYAHSKLAMLLFYSGSAYGPKGMIWGTGINGVDRNLLYPAIRAVAANPIGQARGTLGSTYQNLTAADVNALADTLVDSIQFRAPADKMFSAGIRDGGLIALEKYNIAEGVPVAIEYMLEDGRASSYTSALGVLEDYAAACKSVTPDPDIVGFCKELLSGPNAAAAQAVLNAINANTNAITLTPFKSIQSVTANTPTVTLPANQNSLHCAASDFAQGELTYTWRKVHGLGNVTFTPNGTAAAKDTTIQFDNAPGNYLFECTVSDHRGFTEVYGTVPVTLYNSGGGLPPNGPPTADPQSVTANTASLKPITLTGTDPEGYPLIYTITTPPQNGSLLGTPPDLSYVSNGGYTGADSFVFRVMDTEGQVSSATVDIAVNTSGVQLLAYEGFDYPVGILTGQNGGQGFSGGWLAPRGVNEQGSVWDETTNVTYPNETTLNWDGALNNNFSRSPATGARYAGATPSGSSNLVMSRNLSSDAGTLAGEDGVLWMSAVFHFPHRNYNAGINLGLGNGYMWDRGRDFGTTTTDFIGACGWIPSAANSKLNTVIVKDKWTSTADDAWATSPDNLPATSLDLIVVLKYTFGPTSDTVEGFVFDENVTTDLNEAVFNAGKITTTGSIDESTLNVLSTCQSRFDNAIDEIRIGNSFAAVVGFQSGTTDASPPILASESIVDDRNGESVIQNSPVNYTLTFSEAMDTSSISAADFGNAGTASIAINSITHTLPGVCVVQVTPTSTGTLVLRINAGAVLTDAAGNPLDTAGAIIDDTEISVSPQLVQVPDVIGMTQSAAESAITAAGLAVGTISNQYHASIPAGSVISQNPTGDNTASLGTSVSLVVSLGPSNGISNALAEIPVSGEITGTMADAQTSNNTYQSFRELQSGGKPNNRISYLEHKWLFDIPMNSSLTFHIEAHHTSNTENDDFIFAFSTNGVNGTYTNMLTVTKTADNNTSQSFVLPANISGSVHVRVLDTNRTAGNRTQDTLFIDRMYFLTEAVAIMETVPNVVGLSQSAAELSIGASSLAVGNVTTQHSETVAAGNVISQDPAGGQSVEQGSSVNLVVSLGPPIIMRSIAYDGNGNTGGTAPVDPSSPYASGSTVTVLGAGTLLKTGHTFTGWNTSANGSGTSYAPSATFSIGSDVTLYAQWTLIPVSVVTNTNTVGVPEGNTATFQVKLSDQPAGTTAVTVARSSGDADISVSSGASLTFTTANWDTYQTVTLAAAVDADAQDGTATITCTPDNPSFNSGQVTATETEKDATLTVASGGNGATVPNGAVVVEKGATSAISATANEGYDFVNWTVTSGAATLGDANSASTTVSITAPASIQANFTPKVYVVSYDGNGNTTGTAPTEDEKIHDVDLTLATNSGNLTKTGYSFAGWNTADNGSGIDYAAGGIYSGNDPLTLYAKWVAGANGTWAQTGTGPFDWGTAGNWDGNIIASGADRTAFITPDITGDQIVNLDAPRTIGNITFTDATNSSNNLTISGASILTLARSSGIPLVDVTQSARTLFIASQISGSNGLQKNGPGTLTLSHSANGFTGGINLSAGGLGIGHTAALGANTVSVTGNSTIAATSGTISNTINVGNNTILSLQATGANNTTTTFSSAITGTGVGITLVAGGGSSTRTVELSNAGHNFTGNITLPTTSGSNDFLTLGSMGDGGSIVYGRAGWRSVVTYNGSTALNLGTRSISLASTFGGFGGTPGLDGGGNPINMFQNHGGVATISPDMVVASSANHGVFYFGGSNTGDNTFSGLIADNPGTGTLGIGKWDAGKWILSNANNSFQGNVYIGNGTLSVANLQALGNGSVIQLGIGSGTGILEYTGSTHASTARQTVIGSLHNNNHSSNASILSNGTGTLSFTNATFNSQTVPWTQSNNLTTRDRTLTLGGSNTGANEIQGVIQDNNISGTNNAWVGVSKIDAGTWVLSGPNTYSGTTSITAGKLLIDGDQSLATGNVSVSANATLGGTGTIGGNTTISANGRLEFSLSTADATHNKLELATGKSLAFSGASVLTITSGGGASPGSYTLITAPGGITGNAPATLNLPVGWEATVSKVGNDLVLEVTSTGGPGPVDHFQITGVPAQTTLGTEITGITITAQDAGNETATSFNGTVTFGGTAGITGTSAQFTNGVLSGVSITPMVAGADLAIEVDDGSGHSGSATISVQSLFAAWAGGTFAHEFTQTDPAHNPDGDNLNNLQEFAFGMDPTSPSVGRMVYVPGGDLTSPGLPILKDADGNPATIGYNAVFTRRKDHEMAGLTYTVEFSADLRRWTTSSDGMFVDTGVDNPAAHEAVSVPFPSAVDLDDGGTAAPKFFRVNVQ